MNRLKILLTKKITSDRLDLSIAQLACFATAPALMYFALRAVGRHATTTSEAVTGILATVVAALFFVLVGLLVPLASPAWRGNSPKETVEGQS